MPTLRAAAQLLREASDIDGLAALAATAGCDGAASPLDDQLLGDIGIASLGRAFIVEGPGALRALLLHVTARAPLREVLSRVASRLATRTPHVLWLIVAARHASAEVAIAAWTAKRRPPRVASLVVDCSRVLDSDAETLSALSAAADPRPDADELTHARWVEVLGREALTRRFFRVLERQVTNLAASLPRGTEADRREIALLYCSRLLFLSFLEAKGWLDEDRGFLARLFDRCMTAGGGFHRRVLLPLFFGTLNTRVRNRAPASRAFGKIPFLNGGLFAPGHCERRLRRALFPDEQFGALLQEVFARYRFTAREQSDDWAEAAVDPEMLGKAFESLMQSDERRSSGAFYTPQSLVSRVTAAGFACVLRPSSDASYVSSLTELSRETRRMHRTRLEELTVLDPACGSGAFLVYALERISELCIAHGDLRPVADVRRDVLTRSIFGVDRNPTAVWLCELRLWLSVVIECETVNPLEVAPLPNLDRNIRVGDSLAGDGLIETVAHGRRAAHLRQLRDRYARAPGPRKESLARQLDRDERSCAVALLEREIELVTAQRRELLIVLRGRDLFGQRRRPTADERRQAALLRQRAGALRSERRRVLAGGALPFSFGVQFADVASRGGFDLVIGNPPWVRLHRIPAAERDSLRHRYRVFRAAAWEGGAARAHAGAGFAAQVDLAALFVERALRLLRPGAALALLLPAKLWQSLAGGGVRRLLVEETRIDTLEDHTAAPQGFDAVVYPSLLVAQRWSPSVGAADAEITASAQRRGCDVLTWRLDRTKLSLDETPGSPWLIVPPAVRTAFDRVQCAGVPLAESTVGRPHLGIKCGFNLAFIVQRVDTGEDNVASVVAANGRRGHVERDLLRPVLRGESLRPWCAPASSDWLIWTHGPRGAPLERLPPHAAHWLAPWRRQLLARADAKGNRWWSLFRTDAARSDCPRVVWADMGRTPRATLLRAGDASIPLNTCYVTLCANELDALALVLLLNSPLIHAWLAALAEPARGGYHRYLGWTMSLLPLPRDWPRARAILSVVAERAFADAGAVPASSELLEECLAAYRLRRRDVAPLLEWFVP